MGENYNNNFPNDGSFQGMDGMNQGMNNMNYGMGDMNQGANNMNYGMGDMNQGMGNMNYGMGNMNQGMGNMNYGMGDMNQGANNMNYGMGNMNQGMGNMNYGMNNMNQGMGNMNKGMGGMAKSFNPFVEGITASDYLAIGIRPVSVFKRLKNKNQGLIFGGFSTLLGIIYTFIGMILFLMISDYGDYLDLYDESVIGYLFKGLFKMIFVLCIIAAVKAVIYMISSKIGGSVTGTFFEMLNISGAVTSMLGAIIFVIYFVAGLTMNGSIKDAKFLIICFYMIIITAFVMIILVAYNGYNIFSELEGDKAVISFIISTVIHLIFYIILIYILLDNASSDVAMIVKSLY